MGAPLRLTPDEIQRLGPDARARVAASLAAYLGRPVAVGDALAEPTPPPARAAPRRVRPHWRWALGGGIVVGMTLFGGALWGALTPRGSVPLMAGPQAGHAYQSGMPAGSSTAPAPTPAPQTTSAPTPAPAAPRPAATVPAQVLTPPPPAGATVCSVQHGALVGCHWVASAGE
jgi:hypothetical protein